jgi:iron complex outermembrane recepter protein
MHSRLFFLSLCLATIAKGQYKVHGRVVDQVTLQGIPSAAVFVKGTTLASMTNADGQFQLEMPRLFDSLQVRSTGYRPCSVACSGSGVEAMLLPAAAMEEVVVTAGRGAQNRNDIPVAVSSIEAQRIAETRATVLSELITKTPGVNMVNLNNEQHAMSIRQPMGTSPYYLYMEDGIPLRTMGVFNHNALIEVNMPAIGTVEIVKGPASSLYGPEAVGGAINFITPPPSDSLMMKSGVHADQYGYRRLQYGMSSRVSSRSAVSVSGYSAMQRNGWLECSDYSKNALSTRFDHRLGNRTKLTVTGTYVQYYSQTPGSTDSVAFYSRAYSSPSRFTYRAVEALRGRASVEHAWNTRNQSAFTVYARQNAVRQNPAYAIRWNKGSTTARGEVNSNAFSSFGIMTQHTVRIPHLQSKIIAGFSADRSPVKYAAHQVDLSAVPRADGSGVEEFQLLADRTDIQLADYSAVLWNPAVYIQSETRLHRNVALTLGARYDLLHFTYHNFVDQSAGEKSFQRATPRAGINYKAGKHAGFYATYSMGFSPPGLTTIFTRRAGTTGNAFYYDLEPAVFHNYETGGWMRWYRDRLNLSWAVYQMNGANELLNVRQPDNSTDYQSAGKTLHRGIELGVTYAPSKTLIFRLGGTYALHRFESFTLSRKSNEIANVDGKIMPSAPSIITSNEVVWRPAFAKGLRVGMEWQYVSAWYQNQTNTIRYDDRGAFGLRGASVLNLRTGYTWKGFELYANVVNLTDELYASNVTRGNSASSVPVYTPAAPRTIVLGFEYTFKKRGRS